MKFLSLLFTNLVRNLRRSLLTVASITVSLFLVATLLTVQSELESPPDTPASALRLICRHRVSLANPLPTSYRLKISQVAGVDAVVGSIWFGGIYKDPKNFFGQFAIDSDRFFDVYGDVTIPEKQKEEFLRDRTGAIAGDKLAARFGWQVGDRINLRGARFEFDPELTLRGIYRGGGDDGSIFYFHRDYLNEGIRNAVGPGIDSAGFYVIKARAAEWVPRIAEAVDAMFRNTSAPTKTESEQSFVLGHLAIMGNVRFLVTSISSVVIFTIVLVTANTMAMSIRERAREIGILKALGFRRSQVLMLLLGESVALSLGGALLGSLSARLIYSNVKFAAVTIGMIQHFIVTPATLAICSAAGILVGVVAAGLPAWRAASRPVIDTLRET